MLYVPPFTNQKKPYYNHGSPHTETMIPKYMTQISRRLITSRLFQTSARINNEGSLFGSLGSSAIDKDKPTGDRVLDTISDKLDISMEDGDEGKENMLKKTLTPENDKQLQDFIKSKRTYEKPAKNILLTPLKRQIYELNCRKNGGFYKRNTVVTVPETKKRYKLHLTREEIETLEPSIYLQSYRIKSTMKKATKFLRMFKGMDLKKGITQCHFAKKALGREVGDLLERGIDDAKTLGLNVNDLYIAEIWTGSDGAWTKRIDIKGRGRMGIIRHRYIHVKCILKSKQITLKRLDYEKQLKQQKRKPWVQLANEPIRGVPGAAYRW